MFSDFNHTVCYTGAVCGTATICLIEIIKPIENNVRVNIKELINIKIK